MDRIAYLPNRSGCEAVRKIIDITENANATKQDIFLLSADIESAFDTVYRDFILDIIQRLNFALWVGGGAILYLPPPGKLG